MVTSWIACGSACGMPVCNSNESTKDRFFARHPGDAERFHEVAKLMPMLFGLALALAPAFADGVPAASLQQPGKPDAVAGARAASRRPPGADAAIRRPGDRPSRTARVRRCNPVAAAFATAFRHRFQPAFGNGG